MTIPNWSALTDEEIVLLAQQGNRKAADYLVTKYADYIEMRKHGYFLPGGDDDDLRQEARIGLLKAIRDYDVNRKASFKTFANLCITRQILTSVKNANRRKHGVLSTADSLDAPTGDHEETTRTRWETVPDMQSENPESVYLRHAFLTSVSRRMPELLSHLELQVFLAYVRGEGYQDIARRMNRSPKSIDNAIQRAKQKLSRYVYEFKS